MAKTYKQKLYEMTCFIEDNFDTPEDVMNFLELSIEDLMKMCPDRLVKKHRTTFEVNLEEMDEYTAEDEKEAWDGFSSVDEDDRFTEEDFWGKTQEDNR